MSAAYRFGDTWEGADLATYNRIDQELAESEIILEALIVIAENVEDDQIHLLRRTAISLAWCVRDKLALAGRSNLPPP